MCRYCGRDIPKVVGVTPAVFVPEISTPAKLKPNNPKRKRAILFAIGGIILLCVICIASVLIIGSTPQARESATKRAQTETAAPTKTKTSTKTLVPTRTITPTNTATETTTPAIDSSVKAIMDGAGLSENDAEVAFEVIKSVGFERVERIEFFTDLDTLSAYRAFLGYTNYFMIAFDGNTVYRIKFNDITLYDRDAGGVLDLITNYTLDSYEKNHFIFLAQENVMQALKSPSTAEFPSTFFAEDQWHVGRNKDIVTVQSWVDAENSFGAKLRNQFTVQYSYSSENLLYLELAGNVVYGSLQNP